MDKRNPVEAPPRGPDERRTARILLVEDNEGDATLIRTLFRELATGDVAVAIDRVSDGEAAIAFLRQDGSYQASARPDAVILDINLPKKNGFEVLAELRHIPHLEALPVFVLTTSKSHEDILKSYSLDAASFITKPSTFPELEELVKRIIAVELPRVLK